MQIRTARATDAYRFGLIERTVDPPCWIAEVELWVARDAWAWYRDPDHQPARLWVGEDQADIAVVAAAQQIPDGSWYMPVMFVDLDARGKGLGRAGFQQVVDLIRSENPEVMVRWLVHHENDAMQAVSSSAGAVKSGIKQLMCGGEIADYQEWQLL